MIACAFVCCGTPSQLSEVVVVAGAIIARE